jgi:hypothetical protein
MAPWPALRGFLRGWPIGASCLDRTARRGLFAELARNIVPAGSGFDRQLKVDDNLPRHLALSSEPGSVLGVVDIGGVAIRRISRVENISVDPTARIGVFRKLKLMNCVNCPGGRPFRAFA